MADILKTLATQSLVSSVILNSAQIDSQNSDWRGHMLDTLFFLWFTKMINNHIEQSFHIFPYFLPTRVILFIYTQDNIQIGVIAFW